MTNQPLLTDFPSTIFATARRQAQARLRHCREQLTRRSISGYSLLFEDFLHPEFLAGIDPTGRQRSFGHIPVFWAWAGQILEGNASCSKAVGLIQSWCRALKIPAPNGDTGAYCQARKRIQDSFLDTIHEEVCKGLGRATGGRDLWHGMTLKAIDGSSETLMDTPRNQARYPQHSASKEGCGFPIMGIVGLVNLSHGGWESIACCGSKKHDSRIAPGLLPQIASDDLLLADRAFCSYGFVARLTTEREAHTLIRLHQSRQRKLDWRRGKKISPIERLVRWEKPRVQPPGSTLTKEQWAALPGGITLRYIECSYTDRAGEKCLPLLPNPQEPSTSPINIPAVAEARADPLDFLLRPLFPVPLQDELLRPLFPVPLQEPLGLPLPDSTGAGDAAASDKENYLEGSLHEADDLFDDFSNFFG